MGDDGTVLSTGACAETALALSLGAAFPKDGVISSLRDITVFDWFHTVFAARK